MRTTLRAVVGLLAMLTITAGLAAPAGAVPPTLTDECTSTTVVTEYRYTRPTFTTEHELAKHTRTRLFDWRTWTWGPWSDPEQWVPTSDVEWVTTITEPVWTFHGSGIGWERQRAQLPTGATRDVESGAETTDWLPGPPDGDGWVLLEERTRDEVTDVPCADLDVNATTACPSEDDDGALVVTVTNLGDAEEVVKVQGVEHLVAPGATIDVLLDLPVTGWVIYVDARGASWTFEDLAPVCPEPPADPPVDPPAAPPADPQVTPTLPVTGTRTSVLVGAGLVLFAVGGSLVAWSLRPRLTVTR